MFGIFKKKEEPEERIGTIDITFDKKNDQAVRDYLMGREDLEVFSWRNIDLDKINAWIHIPEKAEKALIKELLYGFKIEIEWHTW